MGLPYTDGMTSDNGAATKPRKKGSNAKQSGALLMFLGVVIAALSGSFGALPATLFFAGLIALIVGIAQRDTDAT